MDTLWSALTESECSISRSEAAIGNANRQIRRTQQITGASLPQSLIRELSLDFSKLLENPEHPLLSTRVRIRLHGVKFSDRYM